MGTVVNMVCLLGLLLATSVSADEQQSALTAHWVRWCLTLEKEPLVIPHPMGHWSWIECHDSAYFLARMRAFP